MSELGDLLRGAGATADALEIALGQAREDLAAAVATGVAKDGTITALQARVAQLEGEKEGIGG